MPGQVNTEEVKGDGPAVFALEWPEPLVTFALSCGSWSSPAVSFLALCSVLCTAISFVRSEPRTVEL